MNNVDDHEKTENASLELRNLKVISALGRGAKGVVFLVRTEDIELLALKTILRASIERKNNANKKSGYKRIWLERDVLSSFQHPLLPKLKGVLSTEKIVGYALDYCPGGDLNSLRKKQTEKMFSDDTIRFYAVELVLALEHLHGSGIVYRDLKPENVMIQENGHIMLIDFDLSTKLSPKTPETRQIKTASPPKLYEQTALKSKKKNWFFLLNKCCNSEISPDDSVHSARLIPYSEFDCIDKSNSFVGTEEYLAPEIILGNGHDFSVDWWCLGVVLYEMLYGTTPFRGSNRKETYYRILSKAPDLVGEATPLRDLIKKLLEKDPKKRISLDEIKGHNFFKSVDWDFVVHLPRPPFIPVPSDIADQAENREIDIESFVEGVFEVEEEEDDRRCKNNSQANHGDELMKANHDPLFSHCRANFQQFSEFPMGEGKQGALAVVELPNSSGQNPIAQLQNKFKELEAGFKLWLSKQSLPVEAAVVTATSGLQGAAIGGFMGTLTQDVSSSMPTPPAGANLNPQAMASFQQAQALAGGPLVQARNFAVMTGVNAGISCVLKRIRGKEDVQSSMAAAFGSGALFSLVSGMGGPNPVPNALTSGIFFALVQGGLFELGRKFSQPPAEDTHYVRTRSLLSSLGLQNYEKNFKKGLLTDTTLPLLTDSALRDVRIPPGPRLLILDRIQGDPELRKR